MGRVERRWGQVLREPADLREFLTEARAEGTLVPLADVAKVQGGVVTRANAYFLVRELAFEEIPTRFGITRGDLARVAVVMDGLETLHRIERPYIRPIVKGPEALLGPTEIAVSDKRLFDVQSLSKEQLRKKRANGALAYLRRGETVPYNVSEDRLKGGFPHSARTFVSGGPTGTASMPHPLQWLESPFQSTLTPATSQLYSRRVSLPLLWTSYSLPSPMILRRPSHFCGP
jgi:hypothetical protein